jgi:WG repeat protein
MKCLPRNAIVTLTGLSFIFLCLCQEPLSHASSKRELSRGLQKKPNPQRLNTGDPLTGEWRVECGVGTYHNGKLSRTSQDKGDSLVVLESDPDGSYYLYRFPLGFGEGLPRLRKVNANLYEGDDTVRGITTVVKQSVSLESETITINQTIIDAASKQTISETKCTGSRLRSSVRLSPVSRVAEICSSGRDSGHLPDKRLAGRYRFVKPFSDGLAAVAVIPRGTRSPKWGFIDETGRVVIPMRYDQVTSFHDGLAAVGKYYGSGRNLKWGVVEKLGPQVTPQVKYDTVKILGEGFAAVGYAVPGRSGVRWNLINRENTTIFHGFDEIECFVGGRARATQTDGNLVRRGYVDKVGDFFADHK